MPILYIFMEIPTLSLPGSNETKNSNGSANRTSLQVRIDQHRRNTSGFYYVEMINSTDIIQGDFGLAHSEANHSREQSEQKERPNLDDELYSTQFTEMFMFGSARYLIVPCVWIVMGILGISTSFVLNPGATEAITQCCYLLSTTINLLSGWRICCDNWIKISIRNNCHNTSAKTEAGEMLQRIIIIGFLIFSLLYSGGIVGYLIHNLSTHSGIEILWVVLSCFSPFAFYMSNAFLVSLWLWICWLKNQVHCKLAESVTQQTIVDDTFYIDYFDNFRDMVVMSDLWNGNQITRVITCIPVAYLYVYLGLSLIANEDISSSRSTSGYALVFTGMFFYLEIWLSVASGGFVNDFAYRKAARNIIAIEYMPDPSMSKTEFDMYRVNTLQRMKFIGETYGIKFAGVTLSIQKAISVGSILITIMFLKYRA